ncbi:MAG: hypothetical protein WBX35_13235, partial [Pseudolabrys sp.]
SRDCAGDIAKYWSHLIAPISMVICAFAVTGRSEIANAVQINRSLISLPLLDNAPTVPTPPHDAARILRSLT